MNFDFNKKDEIIDEKESIFEKKKKTYSLPKIPKIINLNLNIKFDEMPENFWAIMIAIPSVLYMNLKVEDAGWALFLAFLMIGKRKGIITFALAMLGLFGMSQHIEGAGWLLFFAFMV